MPPRRERQHTEGVEGPAEPTVAQPQEEVTVAQRLERRRAELLQKRQLESIQEIEQELAGGPRASSVAVTGEESSDVSLVSRKRAASTELSYSAKRALAPPIYKGLSLRELRDFLLGCDVYFNAIEEHVIRRRIAVAASYIRDDALRQWSRLMVKPTTWPAFELALRDMIQDPANRMSSATLKLKEAKQGERQSVREFANWLEEIEEDIPEMSQEESRAWSLLNGLRTEVRSGVLREEREIRTREQVIASAQRLHELGTMGTGVSHAFRSGGHGQGSQTQASRRAESKEESTLEGRTETRKCHRCYKRGHIIRDCPEVRAEMKKAV
jgi:hypothetical protein